MLATILGFVVGIARLSRNFLLAKLAAGYVELIRNVPLLLQLLFWYNAVLKALPDLRDSWTLPGSIFLNNRGFFSPYPIFSAGIELVVGAFVVGVIGAIALRALGAARSRRRTGEQSPVGLVALGLIIGLPLLAFFVAGMPATLEYPEKGRFNIRGGMEILPEFVALLFGLVLYTGAFIAEVVRAGIMAVSNGQTEAAGALGLRTGPTLQAGGHPAGDARDHSAADQPVSQPDQELLARGVRRLSRSGAGLHRHGAQSDRPGGRGRDDHDGGLSHDQPRHLDGDELVQRAHRAGGAVTPWRSRHRTARSSQQSYVRAAPVDAMPAPAATTGAIGWLRANLFSSPANIALTLLSVAADLWIVPPLIEFLFIHAVWSGSDREACLPTAERPEVGACWAFVRDRFAYFIYGSYPIPERWRVDIFFAMLAVGIVWLLWLEAPRRDLGALYFFVVLPIVSYILLSGMPAHRPAQGRHLAVGRRAGHHRGVLGRHRVLAADRHPAGARAALDTCRR